MSDFKWRMQERIDQGMNPDEAYHATREAYADAADLQRKRAREDGITQESNPDEYEYLRLLEKVERDERGEALDTLADNETDDEAEYHRLRAEAAEERGEKS